ncbi:MAG: TIGR02281 family clan AA aspartic protease [Pseudomonadota bacterium]
MKIILFIVALLALPTMLWAADSVTVKGLFKGAALLIIDGEQVLLKQGKSQQGVRLIEATSRDALLEINGQRQRVGLSRQVGGQYQEVNKKTVRIASQSGGHHWVRGQINGRYVDFVVDTGASIIAINLSTAKRLGIDYEAGQPSYSSTANGLKPTRLVTLNKVTVGEITQYNVRASVSLDDALPVTLLGNSFLSRVNLRTDNGVLILESK